MKLETMSEATLHQDSDGVPAPAQELHLLDLETAPYTGPYINDNRRR
ncbi:MAG: hypothetical protein WBE41_10100 [Terracidiphilus sp.]